MLRFSSHSAAHRTLRLVVSIGVTMLLLAAGFIVSPGIALAHGELIESRPAAGTIVGGTITAVELQFVGIRHPGNHRVSLTGPDGTNVVTEGDLVQDFQKLTLPIAALSTPGEYLVNYRVDGIDGDVSVITFPFIYDPGAEPPAPMSRLQLAPSEPRTALNVMIVFTSVLAVLVAAWIARRLWITR